MNTFPTIATLEDLAPHVQDNPQIRIKTESNGMIVACYMVQDEDTFSSGNEALARECRGITFRPDGKIAARTLHKFFNIGEREDTLPHVIDWSRVVRIMDKRDGSMVTPVPVNGTIKFKTKKTFDTKEAALADQIASATPGGIEWITRMLTEGFTPTFEVTSLRFPIVVVYDKEELTLLHIRDNVTGRYISCLGDGGKYTHDCPFPIVENVIDQFMDAYMVMGCFAPDRVSWDKLKAAAETTENLEGWIIQFDSGDMVKLKTKWYVDLHHAVTFTRWRDIARAVCDDKADDLKGAFAMTGRSIEPILHVERTIKQKIEGMGLTVGQIIVDSEGLDAKGMALKFKDHPLFGLIMMVFRNKEPDWMAWYVKHHLDSDWGLEVVEVNA
jgi:RNA ligase